LLNSFIFSSTAFNTFFQPLFFFFVLLCYHNIKAILMNEQQFTQLRYAKLEKELAPQKAVMGKAADAILDQDVSSYPIFVVHQHIVDIGIPIVEQAEKGPLWSVNASTLEELATKKIITPDKIDSFKQVYKPPQEFLCLFVLSDLGANFIFLPRE
jgi:hypothetical protein